MTAISFIGSTYSWQVIDLINDVLNKLPFQQIEEFEIVLKLLDKCQQHFNPILDSKPESSEFLTNDKNFLALNDDLQKDIIDLLTHLTNPHEQINKTAVLNNPTTFVIKDLEIESRGNKMLTELSTNVNTNKLIKSLKNMTEVDVYNAYRELVLIAFQDKKSVWEKWGDSEKQALIDKLKERALQTDQVKKTIEEHLKGQNAPKPGEEKSTAGALAHAVGYRDKYLQIFNTIKQDQRVSELTDRDCEAISGRFKDEDDFDWTFEIQYNHDMREIFFQVKNAQDLALYDDMPEKIISKGTISVSSNSNRTSFPKGAIQYKPDTIADILLVSLQRTIDLALLTAHCKLLDKVSVRRQLSNDFMNDLPPRSEFRTRVENAKPPQINTNVNDLIELLSGGLIGSPMNVVRRIPHGFPVPPYTFDSSEDEPNQEQPQSNDNEADERSSDSEEFTDSEASIDNEAFTSNEPPLGRSFSFMPFYNQLQSSNQNLRPETAPDTNDTPSTNESRRRRRGRPNITIQACPIS